MTPTDTPHLDDACADGEHVIPFSGGECRRCGLSSQTITDWLGHDYRRPEEL